MNGSPLDEATVGLEFERLTVAFGGLRALDDVTLAAPMGRITGLIGPNGAGKTTTFNVATGLVRSAHGAVRLLGSDVSSLSIHARARAGLGRTFQRMQLCDQLTVRENTAVGCEAAMAGRNLIRHVLATRHERGLVADRTQAALETCGIAHLGVRPVGELSTGERRLVELARALAGSFRVLLLDEPSSGLDAAATASLGRILTRVVAERGLGILLVEHDMPLVLGISSYIHVLDFGRVVFAGTPDAVRASDVVRAAYLGTAA